MGADLYIRQLFDPQFQKWQKKFYKTVAYRDRLAEDSPERGVVIVHVVIVVVIEVVIHRFTASAGLLSAPPWFVEARRRAVNAHCWRLHPPVTAHPSAANPKDDRVSLSLPF